MKASINLQKTYTDSFLQLNPHIVIDDLVDYIEPESFNPETQKIGLIILVNGVATHEVFEKTPEEISEQQQKEVLANETEKYKKRTQDGINAYAEISAEFRLAKLSRVLTEEQHGAIEAILIPVRNEVLAGQWISALQKLEEIGVVIGADLYNRLHTQISNYIAENY